MLASNASIATAGWSMGGPPVPYARRATAELGQAADNPESFPCGVGFDGGLACSGVRQWHHAGGRRLSRSAMKVCSNGLAATVLQPSRYAPVRSGQSTAPQYLRMSGPCGHTRTRRTSLPRIVAPKGAGSRPVGHPPTFRIYRVKTQALPQVVRRAGGFVYHAAHHRAGR
jgi:hypothetical protein